jgi:hypothetical protein
MELLTNVTGLLIVHSTCFKFMATIIIDNTTFVWSTKPKNLFDLHLRLLLFSVGDIMNIFIKKIQFVCHLIYIV